ncbi:MAG: class I mannose-6-phosphate isomerase [Bacteroidales bacterium]|nr:class I mannose-6-phosphate isomerase [Bacteroidales bacterium]
MEKKLYPFKFIPVPSRRPWGGSALVAEMGKHFVEVDEDGNETILGTDVLIGESWELADMGIEDSVVENGWLAGNTISELMETYLERIVGEDVYNYYGRQFPLLIKFLDINDKLSVQVHPDDEVAAERYDSLGKAEIWYVMDAKPGAKMYCGFTREVSAQEFYDRCKNGTVDEILNVIEPRKGDVIYITPGTVHAADGGLLIAEIQESSDMTFRLYDWGREFDPKTARKTHLEEAIDVIDYRAFDPGLYRKGPLWGDEASYVACRPSGCSCGCGCDDDCDCGCHEGEECHCHEEGHDCECHCHQESQEGQMIQTLVDVPQFTVSKIALTDPLHIYTEKFQSFIVYICLEGAASIQVPSTNDKGEACMENYEFAKGETVLVPADMPDFFLVPRDRSTLLLEGTTRPVEEVDGYIDPETEAFLEGEDYDGMEDESDDEPMGPAGASPLNFFS